MKKANTIVIPVYSSSVSHNEMISLSQCFKILGKHPITFIAPESLDMSIYKSIAQKHNVGILVERFADAYFENIKGYNHLMLSKEFYQRFLNYKYILIYQLDCFVFRDEIDNWCDQNYDYIGAPWTLTAKFNYLYLLYHKLYLIKKQIMHKIRSKKGLRYYHFENQVGNGGFSLRKPAKFIETIDFFEKNGKIDIYKSINDGFYQEDVFLDMKQKNCLKFLLIK